MSRIPSHVRGLGVRAGAAGFVVLAVAAMMILWPLHVAFEAVERALRRACNWLADQIEMRADR